MTARQQEQTAMYQVEELRKGAEGVTLWGIRRPDGTWVQSMGEPQWYISRPVADRDAAQLNRDRGLTA